MRAYLVTAWDGDLPPELARLDPKARIAPDPRKRPVRVRVAAYTCACESPDEAVGAFLQGCPNVMFRWLEVTEVPTPNLEGGH